MGVGEAISWASARRPLSDMGSAFSRGTGVSSSPAIVWPGCAVAALLQCTQIRLWLACSHIEQKVQHIPVLDDVVLAFGAHLAGFLGALFALVLDEVVEGDGLGADEAAFEVGVDDAGGFGGGVAFVDGPGAGGRSRRG